MKLELFQPHFFELFIFGEIRFLKQLFKPLSVAMVFRMQAVYLLAQQRILSFVHQAPPYYRTFTYKP